jgi:uncharacterized membrane protein YphA (DoxX/SURF4 family)
VDALWTVAAWAGRLLFALVFLNSGFFHLAGHAHATAYAKSKNLPMAGALVGITGVQIIAGAAMILLNWHPIVGAFLLVLFLVPTAFIMHNFWTLTDPMMKAGDQAHFFKDLALAGAALMYAALLHASGTPL